MTHRVGIIGTAIVALVTAMPAAAQDQDVRGDDGTRQAIRYDISGPVSPSSGTATVSASSVPQAMERLTDDGARADISLGSIYAEGKFGTASKTTIWSSALGARMRIRSRSTIFTGIDSTPILVAPDTAATKRTFDGFGDLTLGAAYTIVSANTPLEVQLSGRAKINTATESSGLSSGKNDYAGGVDVSYPIGKLTPFGSFSYRFLGDTARYDLRDGPAASAGASYALGTNSFLLASYHYSRAATRLVADAHELFAGASTRLAGTPLRLTGFATAGLSRGAPAASAGLSLSLGLQKRNAR
jgi:hypothetical protein